MQEFAGYFRDYRQKRGYITMIAIANDHVGYELKHMVIELLDEMGLKYHDFGAYDTERSDYPTFGGIAAKAVAKGECERGILLCGTGVGISITANKVQGVRCVVCSEPYSAILSRKHNDTNMIAIGSRVVGPELARMIVKEWLTTDFEGGRHQMRVDIIREIEQSRD